MPTYTIQVPNGKQVYIAADTPDAAMASAQQYWQQNPDPKGAQAYQAAVSDAQANLKRMGGGGGWQSLVNSAMLGFDAQLEGGGAANQVRLQNLGTYFGGKAPAYTPDQADRATQQVDNDALAQYRAKNPTGAMATGVAGSFLTPGVGEAFGWAGGAPTLGGRMLRGAMVGGGVGAAAGAGNAQDGSRLQGALSGGAMGAAIGGLLPPVAQVAGSAANGIVRTANNVGGAVSKALTGTPSYFLNPQDQGVTALARAMHSDGATPELMSSLLSRYQMTGASDPSLMDLATKLPNGGQNTIALLRGATMNSPSARGLAVSYRNNIEGNLQDNAIQRTYGLTPDDQRSASSVLGGLQDQQGELSNQQFQAPYAQSVPAAPVLPALAGSAGAKGIGLAATEADAMGMNPAIAARIPQLNALKAASAPPPRVPTISTGDPEADAWASSLLKGSANPASPPPSIDIGTLDRIKVALNNLGNDASSKGQGGLASGYFQRAQAIDDHLAANSPAYAAARDAYAARAQGMGALKSGMTGYGSTPDQLAAATAPNKGLGGIGYRQALVDKIGASGSNATGVLNTVATSTNQGQKLGALYGTDAAQSYRDALSNELLRVRNARDVDPNYGSQTGVRTTDAASDLANMASTAVDLKTGHGILRVLAKLQKGLGLNDAERQAVVNLALGQAQSGLGELPPRMGAGNGAVNAVASAVPRIRQSQSQSEDSPTSGPPLVNGGRGVVRIGPPKLNEEKKTIRVGPRYRGDI